MDVDSHSDIVEEIHNDDSVDRDVFGNIKKKKDEDLRYDVELTRAIKENHYEKIVDARLCPFEGGEAFFATVGSNQLMVYDLEVRGNFMATLLNYRNWPLKTMRNKHVVWTEHLEKNNTELLEKKRFNTFCWVKRWKDFWLAVADNEQQIHILSVTYRKCIKLVKCAANVTYLMAHPMYPNMLCTVDEENKCRFINCLNDEVICTLSDKVCRIAFSPSGKKFCAVLTNGSVREYAQRVDYINDDDLKQGGEDDGDEDVDVNRNRNRNTNSNKNRKKQAAQSNKKLVVEKLNVFKAEEKGASISDLHYYNESQVIVANEQGEFKWVNMDNSQLVQQWKVSGRVSNEGACKFDINAQRDCMVYGNGEHQVQIYDLKNKKYLRRVDTGRGKKMPFSFAAFCRHQPQSLMMVCDDIVLKFDPLELVKDYFPSTADFAVQERNGIQCFTKVHKIQYEAEKSRG
mmetsp:Transcript_63547/g.101138  ORF Transcript_63547/g.101138 Transcript_63547/m.101138 type:complete len:458 (+) Transcript_63547:46-1419(+)